jgi:hypothetical protein
MAIVSHLHHLFNPETCQSYIHMLRYVTLERSASPMSSVSEPPCWSLVHNQATFLGITRCSAPSQL